jgi:hypothetical protein
MLRGKSPEKSTLFLHQSLIPMCRLIPFKIGVPEPALDAFHHSLELLARRRRQVAQHDGATSISNPPALLSAFDGTRKCPFACALQAIDLDADFRRNRQPTDSFRPLTDRSEIR